MQTIYVVETYQQSEGELWPERAVICRSDDDARSRALFMADSAVGVIAYSQEVAPDAGDYRSPVVLARYGAVPVECRPG